MKAKEGIKVRGFFKLQLVNHETGKVEGEFEGPNTVTNFGLDNACAGASIGAAGSCQALSACLATQSTAVNATQISLVGVENAVIDLTPSTVVTGTARNTCSFAGSDNSATLTIGSVGLHSNTNSATDMIAGQTFTTSQMATNQDLNMTYELQFS
jgi:spore maturation protein SpmA